MTGGSTLGIGITMFLRDQFSGPAGRIRNSARMMQADMARMNEEQLRSQRNINAGLALATAAAVRGMSRMVVQAADFSYEMQFVKSLTESTTAEGKKLEDLATSLGQRTMFFSQDVAEGMRFMAMAGMSSKEITKNIEAAVYLAGSTKGILGGKGGAADIMTNVMKQFNVSFENSMHVADILSYAVNKANTNLFDLGEALKYAGSTAMDLQVPLQETTAMIMALGNAGIQGSMAGVAVENALRYASRAIGSYGTGQQKKALAQIGLSPSELLDAEGNLKSMVEVIKAMATAIDRTFGEGMNIEKQSILQAIFGVRGKRASSLLLRNFKEFDRFVTEVSTKSTGHAGKITNQMMEDIKGYILRTKTAWQNMWIAFTRGIEPTVKFALNLFERLFNFLKKVFETPLIGSFITHAVAGFLVLKTVTFSYRAVVAGLRLLHLQLSASHTTMTTVAVKGWDIQTAAALRYAAAARAAGAYSGLGQAAALASSRMIITNMQNSALKVGATGRFYRARAGLTGAVGAQVGGAVAMRYAAMYGGRAVASTVAPSLLARAIGFLGGPWGIALAFVLPGLIGLLTRAINSNKESVDDNTNALNKEKLPNVQGMRYEHEFDILTTGSRMLALQAAGINNFSPQQVNVDFENTMGKALAKFAGMLTQNTGDIIINLDGNTIFRNPIENLKKDFRKAGIY